MRLYCVKTPLALHICAILCAALFVFASLRQTVLAQTKSNSKPAQSQGKAANPAAKQSDTSSTPTNSAKPSDANAPASPNDKYAKDIDSSKFKPEQVAELKRAFALLDQVSVLWRQEKCREAIPLAEEALAIRDKILPPDDHWIANACNWLRTLHSAIGDRKLALQYALRAVKVDEPSRPESASFANDLYNVGSVYQDLDRYADAMPYYQRALKLNEKLYGKDHPEVADVLNDLAELNRKMAHYAEAFPQYQRALQIREKAFGPDDPNVATSLSNLALYYADVGKYAESLAGFQRVGEIRKKTLGPGHPLIGQSENNLGGILNEMGNYKEAMQHYQKALEIWEKSLGPEADDTAMALNNLGELHRKLGNFAEALTFHRRALAIREKIFEPDSYPIAASLNNLGCLYQEHGDYAGATAAYQRALKICDKSLGPEHPSTATCIHNLANVYHAQGDYDKAIPLYQRAESKLEKTFGPDHPNVANCLNDLAEAYRLQHNYAAALPLYQRALAIREKSLGPDSTETAVSVNNLGLLNYEQGKLEAAEPLYRRALKIGETVLGPNHYETAAYEGNLGMFYQTMGNHQQALPYFEQACDSGLRRLELASALQSEQQQLKNVKASRFYLNWYVASALLAQEALAKGGKTAKSERPNGTADATKNGTAQSTNQLPVDELAQVTYSKVLAWKGSVLLRQRMQRLSRQAANSKEQLLWAQLESISARLATASLDSAGSKQANTDDVQKLTDEKEHLESQLSSASAGYRKVRAESAIKPDDLAKLLPADTAMVDVLQYYRRFDERQKNGPLKITNEQRLVAFVVRRDRPVVMIDLGPMTPIDEAVEKWRSIKCGFYPGKSSDQQPGAVLRKLVFDPIAPFLNGATTVLVSPDGSLNKIAWAALPGSKPGTYLVEDLGIATLPAPEMLADLLAPAVNSKSTPKGKTESPPSLLLVGDVDYGGAASNSKPQPIEKSKSAGALPLADSGRSVAAYLAKQSFPRLPGTGTEIDRIGLLFAQRFDSLPDSRKRMSATKQAVREEAANHRYLHFATHGFFAPAGTASAAGDLKPDGQNPLEATAPGGTIGINPGLLSGLVLAGANRKSAASDGDPSDDAKLTSRRDDGILTALEVSSLDLTGVDLAVLSACETGLGETAGGEGMLGLQRAFQVAGAATTITSLWSIDDIATQTLMVEFYKRLWDKEHPLGKLEALRQAQLEMLHGHVRGIDLEKGVDDFSETLAPKYWAGFVLSGDWR